MMPAEPARISQHGALAIDAAFLSMGYVDDGQADGPYPDMYEYWSHHQANKLMVVPRALAQGDA
jgi:hypothetical protein